MDLIITITFTKILKINVIKIRYIINIKIPQPNTYINIKYRDV